MEQMRCAQCGRSLSQGDVRAGICPSCGHPVAQTASALSTPAEDDSQTRPMPPGLKPVPDVPPNVPPTAPPPPPAEALTAPATPIPAYRPPALPRSAAESAAPAHTPDATSERTAAMPLSMAPGAESTPPSLPGAESSKPKRAGVGWIAALALLIVLLLGAAAVLLVANGQFAGPLGQANPTATVSPTAGPPPPPTHFTRYTGAGYTIDYPSTWVQTILPGATVNFSNPSVQATFQVQTFDHASDPQSLDDGLIAQLGPALAASGQGSSAVSGKTGPTTVTVAGTLWTREEADVAVTSSGKTATWHVVALAVAHDQQSLLISFYAPSVNFAGQDSAFFEPMLNTLLLVSSQP